MDGVNISKEDLLAAMLETRTIMTESVQKTLADASPLKDACMTAIDYYERSLKELLNLGVA